MCDNIFLLTVDTKQKPEPLSYQVGVSCESRTAEHKAEVYVILELKPVKASLPFLWGSRPRLTQNHSGSGSAAACTRRTHPHRVERTTWRSGMILPWTAAWKRGALALQQLFLGTEMSPAVQWQKKKKGKEKTTASVSAWWFNSLTFRRQPCIPSFCTVHWTQLGDWPSVSI